MLIVRQQQCLIPRQPVGLGADLPFAIEVQPPRLRAALGGQTEGDQADLPGRLNGNGGHGGDADRTGLPRPVAPGHPLECLLLSPPSRPPMVGWVHPGRKRSDLCVGLRPDLHPGFTAAQ
jgi:hypothetical protein